MKIQGYQKSEEQTILTALIVHDRILRQLYEEIGKRKDPFRSRWSNLIARWCFDYYRDHKKAPRSLIQDIFSRYAQREPDASAIQLVEKFLAQLSDDYRGMAKELNENWVLDKAAEYFERLRLEKMAEKVQAALENHDLDAARKFREEAQPLSFSPESWLNPFSISTVRSTLERLEGVRPVIQFRGDMGRFLSPYFERDGFISFAAPEKRGKSFWMMEVAWQGLFQRKKVLYYVLGDMSADQVYRRLYSRMTLKPKSHYKEGLTVPTNIKIGKPDEQGYPTAVLTTEVIQTDPYTFRDVRKAIQLLKVRTASKKNLLRLRCSGASTISASQIETDVRALSDKGWVPDIVVIDYADLLLPETSTERQDYRHQINETWKILRRISTEFHLLLVTATQAAASGYDAWLLRKKDFSEDKRKNAHVTGMLGINQTPSEKRQGIYRLNWIFLRDGIWADNQFLWTAGNLALGCPCFRTLIHSRS